MDYSIFKPGDKVRAIHNSLSGTVLLARPDLLVIAQGPDAGSLVFRSTEFEKIPERTSKFRNVFFLYAAPCFSHAEYGSVFQARGNRKAAEKYVGVFEEVFEDGKLVETKYHPDENA